MSRQTLKKLAIVGALSLGGMAQPAMAQFGLFGGGCCSAPPIPASICGPSCGQPPPYEMSACCAPPPIACAPPQPQYVMQPFTETRNVERIVQRPICETKMVEVPQTEYRPVVEDRVAQVPSMTYQTVPATAYRPVTEQHVRQVPCTTYQTVTEMQCRQRDAGQWITQYRCRPQVAPCAYDNRPGLFGALNRGFYTARMAVTPAVVAERTYVPNVITEQIPVTRQVAVPSTRQVAYNVTRMEPYAITRQVAVPTTQQVTYKVTKMVPITTMRQVATQTVRMVAERITEPVTTTTFRMVPAGNTATVFGGDPYSRNASAIPDPQFAPVPANRTAVRTTEIPNGTSNGNGTVTPAPPAPLNKPRSGRPNSLLENNDDPNPGVPRPMGRNIPVEEGADEEMVELAETAAPTIRRGSGFQGVNPVIERVSSMPSIVRISRAPMQSTAAESTDMTVASTMIKAKK